MKSRIGKYFVTGAKAGIIAAMTIFLVLQGLTGYYAISEDVVPQSIETGRSMLAGNGRFELWYDVSARQIELRDKSGVSWLSTPAETDGSDAAESGIDFAAASMLHVEYADRLGNLNTIFSENDSKDRTLITAKALPKGIRLEFTFPAMAFTIPVQILISDDYLEISILADEVKEENPNYKITKIACMPYFGAAGPEESGYIFVPDGSGAIIDINDKDGVIDDYSQYVYGRDAAINTLEEEALSQVVRMPVFGLRRGEAALFGIITGGASRALIRAAVNGVRNQYNCVYAEFIYRDYDMIYIEKKNQTVRLLEQNTVDGTDFTVRLYFLNGIDADYSGMAMKYQTYLMNEQGLKKTTDGTSPLFIDLYGGVVAQQNFLGFPVRKVIPLTSYNDAKAIVQSLIDSGISDIVLDYIEWDKKATQSVMPQRLAAENRLGGKDELTDLISYLSENSVKLFLEANLTDMVKNSWGYNKLYNSASAIQKSPAIQYRYYPHDQTINYSNPIFLLSPRKVGILSGTLSRNFAESQIPGLSVSTLGNKLYSDFSNQPVSRDESERLMISALETIYNTKKQTLAGNANAYALPFCTYISDTPVSSSNYLVESYEIPFYQMVLHGIKNISTPAVNKSSNIRRSVLKALETGTSVKFQLTARNEDVLKETVLNNLISSHFLLWLPEIKEIYKEITPTLAKVQDRRMIRHERINEYLTKSTFEGGIVVWVNYGQEKQAYEDIIIEAEDFFVTGE